MTTNSGTFGAEFDFRQEYMRYAEVGAFKKTIQDCGSSGDKTWALRAPIVLGNDKERPQTVLGTCFRKSFSIKHLSGATRVTASYIKHAVCTHIWDERHNQTVGKCTVKKIVHSCSQCEIETRSVPEQQNGVESLLEMLALYNKFKQAPIEEAELAKVNCPGQPTECNKANLVSAAVKG